MADAARRGAAFEAAGVALAPGDYLVERVMPEGWVVQEGADAAVALSTRLTPELVLEGHARDLVRALQDLRKTSGLRVEDRIRLTFQHGPALLEEILGAWRETVVAETLCADLLTAEALPSPSHAIEVGGTSLLVHLARV
jgi:isoleucyl-tRNA synthetase